MRERPEGFREGEAMVDSFTRPDFAEGVAGFPPL